MTHPPLAEQEKTGQERGKFIHPQEHGLPESLGIHYESIMKAKEERAKGEAEHERIKAEQKKAEAAIERARASATVK